MNRLDVYTAVHKMQRARLFGLVTEAGRADPADPAGRAALAAAVEAVVDELLAHAEHEDRYIHPLLRERAPATARRLDEEHVALDARLEQLRDVAASYADSPVEPNVLYRAVAAFTAAYLGHLAVEEGEALPALWGSCSDDELAGILVSFRGSRSDTENLVSVLAQLGTLNPPELVQMVSVVLGSVPLADLGEILATLLTAGQLGALRLALGRQPTTAGAGEGPSVGGGRIVDLDV